MIEDFHKRVKEERLRQGISVKMLAEKTGVAETTIRNIESGSHLTNLYVAVALADAFNVSLQWLALGCEPTERTGQWIPYTAYGVKSWSCSECKTMGSPNWRRCPVCEAKMEVCNAGR